MAESKKQTGIALGALFGLIHALWVAAVGAGIGQNIVNALELGHFLSSSYSVTTFDLVTALTGVAGAVIAGYIIGWIFTYVYNFAGEKLDSWFKEVFQ